MRVLNSIEYIFNTSLHIAKAIDTTNLKEPDDQNREADRMHYVGVIIKQSLTTPSHPQVELLCLVVVIKVGGVIGDLVLNARPRRVDIAAAEGNSIH